jgi:anti-sigma regulatory factor (Ser/Thr protein kinase)
VDASIPRQTPSDDEDHRASHIDTATPITRTPLDAAGNEGATDLEDGFVSGHPASLALRSEPASVRLARRFVDHWLGPAGQIRFGEDLQLVTSELVTNAVRHSALAGVRLSRDGDCVVLEVDDAGHGEPEVADNVSLTAPSGRGLVIVDQLVTRWGWRHLPEGGKRVWCRLCSPGEPQTA